MPVIRRRCAVVGSPISHSLSPRLHQAAYAALGLSQWSYQPVNVPSGQLGSMLAALDSSWAGLSLTMPLKREVFAYGQPQDHWSKVLQVANTAVCRWAQDAAGADKLRSLALYNTDVEGIICALAQGMSQSRAPEAEADAFDPRVLLAASVGWQPCPPRFQAAGSRSVVIGTGSTACSALAALSYLGVQEVTLVAHHLSHAQRAEALAQSLGFSTVDLVDMSQGSLVLRQADLVVSTIPAHAADPVAKELHQDRPGVAWGVSSKTPILLDVVYSPKPSLLLQAWRRVRGGVALSGERMLLYQAVRQVAHMTGTPLMQVPVEAMDRALREVVW
ncbi:shikimate 5-dehydrogenase [Bombiscardovia nodaiensis]|uniref:shikimate dehydrogenase (NADP(+)) n=1 Tax=Bombiscardovia nodaiensis TaxID=2932181 RepID=A0ABM8B867_9BIFI|nr:shikimate 5-dehydrogenase [Bombiscardovia nodaiensis]